MHDREDTRALIASNLGSQVNPGWYYNLHANPHVMDIRKQLSRYLHWHARHLLTERRKYWQEALTLYAGYKDYQERAGDRLIPIMVLEPEATND